MAIDASARITLRGSGEALRALQGVTRATRAANKEGQAQAKEAERQQRAAIRAHQEKMRAEERASKAAQRAAQQEARAKLKASDDAQKAAEREAKAIERIQERQAARWQRLAQASADARIKQEQRATRAAQVEAAKQAKAAEQTAAAQQKYNRDILRKAGGFVGAATAGALAGAGVAASTARGIAGVKSIQERIGSANEFRERLVLTSAAAGLSAQERESAQGQVLAASTATGKDIGELMGVLETGQAQFNNLRFFADNLKEIATISKVAGADTGEFATALGFVQQAFGLTGKDAMEAAYLMKASADKGSVELKDFAKDFAASAGIFAMNTGQKGLAGVRQFLGASQGIATGGFGSAESATRLERFATDLNDVDVRKGLAGIGIKNIADKSGKIDVGAVLQQLGGNKHFKSAATRQGIFKEVRSLQAVEALLAAQTRVGSGAANAVDFKTIAGVDAAAGRQAVSSTFADVQTQGYFKMQAEAARMQADTVTNLDNLNGQVLKVAEASDRLETAFGSLSLWANSIAAAGVVGGGVSVLKKLAGGGVAEGAAEAAGGSLAKRAMPTLAKAGGGLMAGLSGLVGAGTTTLGAAGAGAIAGAGAAGLAVGGAAGTLINQVPAIFRDDGQTLSDLIVSKLIDSTRASQLSAGGSRNADGTLVAEIRAQTRKLESIDQGLRAQNVKPGSDARREPR
jgi:hypothetical protein